MSVPIHKHGIYLHLFRSSWLIFNKIYNFCWKCLLHHLLGPWYLLMPVYLVYYENFHLPTICWNSAILLMCRFFWAFQINLILKFENSTVLCLFSNYSFFPPSPYCPGYDLYCKITESGKDRHSCLVPDLERNASTCSHQVLCLL